MRLIQRAKTVPVSIPAPVSGWNARDSIGDMDPKDAVTLTNWFPATTEVKLRNGYIQWATGLPSQVETLLSYSGASNTKLFAVSSGGIYDCTSSGAVGAAAVSGLTNSRFQYVNMETAGGNFLLAVNGADKMRYFDGTTWSADGGTFTVTGADTSAWLSMCLHKQRVWAIQKNSLKAWYLPTGSIAGAASPFDLSAFFQLGGSLAALATWTLDGGQGMDDYLVFISSRGEVLVYGGTDPTGAWAMRGLYRLGSPVGNRCLYKFGGDLLALTQDGLVPMSSALQSSRTDPRVSVSNKIQQAVSDAVSNYGPNFGWQVLSYPKQNALIMNVPVATGQQQYVMNTISGAWCQFTGWAANCWELFNDEPYFGSSTFVGKAWTGYTDNGAIINADGLQAFDYVGAPGTLKRFTMCRPVFRAAGQPSVMVAINTDFDTQIPVAPLSITPVSTATWGSAVWGVSIWSAGLDIYKDWQGASGVGYSAAPRVSVQSQGTDVRWVSTDIVMEHGSIL
jgi:hypothetical protein